MKNCIVEATLLLFNMTTLNHEAIQFFECRNISYMYSYTTKKQVEFDEDFTKFVRNKKWKMKK
jgi:hypothetical protein